MLATGLIALLFHPLRQRVQRGVNRLMYGERDEPYSVLSQLGRRLETTLSPEAVLPTVVETVAQTLKLPHVAVTLKQGGEFQVAASIGDPVGERLVLHLTYQGETIGQLICGLRGGEPFKGEEQRLLEDIASRSAICCTVNSVTRVAANSRAKGMPSSRLHTRSVAASFWLVSSNEGNAALARSTNKRIASKCSNPDSASAAPESG